MTGTAEGVDDALDHAVLALKACALDPGLGGIVLRGGEPLRGLLVERLGAMFPDGAPIRRMPAHVDDDRLLGGIDLAATLARGKAVAKSGLLADANGGALVIPLAERMSDGTAGRIAAALDTGEVTVDRDGLSGRDHTRFTVVALDDGIGPDERIPAALGERLAFWTDLTNARGSLPDTTNSLLAPNAITKPDQMSALVATAAALGIGSIRAPILALRAARAFARLDGRNAVDDEDVALAARLVLAPRATQVPTSDRDVASEPEPPSSADQNEDAEEQSDQGPLEDLVLAAALAALPKDVLARIAAGKGRRGVARTSGGGERRKSPLRGRPMGSRAGMPGGGKRLALIDTLRAAAPWQRLRGGGDRIHIRRDDLRIRRFETQAEALTIFAVDASGSSALARLAEAKGAVELLLAEAYVKRAEVALVAFRGTTAELLLPPTRSLTRARRSLAELPGGGGTPLAAGLIAARELAEAARARGRTPFIVVLTDGRANIAADGRAERKSAEADAQAAAKAIGVTGIAAAFVDISARPRPEGAALAAAMGARYLPLPRADASAMHAAVIAAQRG